MTQQDIMYDPALDSFTIPTHEGQFQQKTLEPHFIESLSKILE